MPKLVVDENGEIRHSDDMQDIIAAPPSWILRWGIVLFFCIITLVIGLSAFIRYPDIVRTQLKVTSSDVPKAIVTKVAVRLSDLLVQDNQSVKVGQPLAYLESTANHASVINLLVHLNQLQKLTHSNQNIKAGSFDEVEANQLGEIQEAYQTFIQSLITYQEALNSGILHRKKGFLEKDLLSLDKQGKQLIAQKRLQEKEVKLAKEEYAMHRQLAADKAETQAELRDAESKYISKQSPLLQTDAALITAGSTYAAKQKEIAELDNQVTEEKSRFLQALNSLVSQAEQWKTKYTLTASQSGKVVFAGVIQRNQFLQAGQEVFYINPGSSSYFGEMAIPQNNMGKIKEHQEVLVKLRSYPFEEYGMIRGYVESINEVPYKDSVFFSKVHFAIPKPIQGKKTIRLKQGMLADAEIITEDATVLQRITRNLRKVINRN